GPFEGDATPGHAAAEGDDDDALAGPKAPGCRGLMEGDGDGCGARVADTVDVDDHTLHGNTESLCGGLDDAQVGLVGDEPVDVVSGPAGVGEEQLRDVDEPGDRRPEGAAPGHADGPPSVGVVLADPVIDEVGLRPVGGPAHRPDAPIPAAAAHHGGRGAVPEE